MKGRKRAFFRVAYDRLTARRTWTILRGVSVPEVLAGSLRHHVDLFPGRASKCEHCLPTVLLALHVAGSGRQ